MRANWTRRPRLEGSSDVVQVLLVTFSITVSVNTNFASTVSTDTFPSCYVNVTVSFPPNSPSELYTSACVDRL